MKYLLLKIALLFYFCGIAPAIFSQLPYPEIQSVVVVPSSKEITIGETFELEIKTKNVGLLGATEGGVTVSFPGFTGSSDDDYVVRLTGTDTDSPGYKEYPRGTYPIHTKNGDRMTVEYLMVEVADEDFDVGEVNTLRIQVEPQEVGSFTVFYRSTMGYGGNYWNDPLDAYYTDQQDWDVNVISINVTEPALDPPEPDLYTPVFTPSSKEVTLGESFDIELSAINDGGDSDEGYISVSFPAFDHSNDKNLVSIPSLSVDLTDIIKASGEGLTDRDGDPILADYLLVDLVDEDWEKDEINRVTLRITPREEGEFPIYLRSTMSNSEESKVNDPSTTSHHDQQSFGVYKHVVNVSPVVGDYELTVNNISGTSQVIPGDRGFVELYNSSGQDVDDDWTSNGKAFFNDIIEGTNYECNIYHDPLPASMHGKEYWGKQEAISITGDNTKRETFTRRMPFILSIAAYQAGVYVNEQEIEPGIPVTLKVSVRNDSARQFSIQPHLYLDRDRISSYDFYSSEIDIISANSTKDFEFQFTPSAAGEYFFNAALEVNCTDLDGYTVTDGWYWSTGALFTVKEQTTTSDYEELAVANWGEPISSKVISMWGETFIIKRYDNDNAILVFKSGESINELVTDIKLAEAVVFYDRFLDDFVSFGRIEDMILNLEIEIEMMEKLYSQNRFALTRIRVGNAAFNAAELMLKLNLGVISPTDALVVKDYILENFMTPYASEDIDLMSHLFRAYEYLGKDMTINEFIINNGQDVNTYNNYLNFFNNGYETYKTGAEALKIQSDISAGIISYNEGYAKLAEDFSKAGIGLGIEVGNILLDEFVFGDVSKESIKLTQTSAWHSSAIIELDKKIVANYNLISSSIGSSSMNPHSLQELILSILKEEIYFRLSLNWEYWKGQAFHYNNVRTNSSWLVRTWTWASLGNYNYLLDWVSIYESSTLQEEYAKILAEQDIDDFKLKLSIGEINAAIENNLLVYNNNILKVGAYYGEKYDASFTFTNNGPSIIEDITITQLGPKKVIFSIASVQDAQIGGSSQTITFEADVPEIIDNRQNDVFINEEFSISWIENDSYFSSQFIIPIKVNSPISYVSAMPDQYLNFPGEELSIDFQISSSSNLHAEIKIVNQSGEYEISPFESTGDSRIAIDLPSNAKVGIYDLIIDFYDDQSRLVIGNYLVEDVFAVVPEISFDINSIGLENFIIVTPDDDEEIANELASSLGGLPVIRLSLLNDQEIESLKSLGSLIIFGGDRANSLTGDCLVQEGHDPRDYWNENGDAYILAYNDPFGLTSPSDYIIIIAGYSEIDTYYAGLSFISRISATNESNNAPTILDQNFDFPEIGSTSIIGNVFASDIDGDILSFSLKTSSDLFSIDSDGTLLLKSSETLDFETENFYSLTVEVQDNGSPVLSNTCKIDVNITDVNEAPQIRSIIVLPQAPDINDQLSLGYEYFDPENDNEGVSRIYWYRNDVSEAEFDNELYVPSSNTAFGDTWHATVIPSDGILTGETYTSNTVQIGGGPETGIIADYPFKGNANDVSGNEHHGVVSGAVLVPDRLNFFENAYQFDGNSSIDVGDIDLTTPFAISIWLKPDLISGNSWVICKAGADNRDNYAMTIQDGNISFLIKSNIPDGTSYVFSIVEAPVEANEWTHCVAQWDGANLSLYLNNTLEVTTSADYTGLITNDSPTGIGFRPEGLCCGQTNYTGILDDIKFFDGPLTEGEIQALYQERDWPGSIDGVKFGDFGLTTARYTVESDVASIVTDIFGPEYNLADWNDLVDFYEQGGNLVELMDGLGFGYHGGGFVTWNGERKLSADRWYFASRKDHDKPSYFLSHADIDNDLICLGSWYTTQYILAKRNVSIPRILHVSLSGSDVSGNGSELNPYQTIQFAINQASSGDEVRVSSGDYYENIVLKSGVDVLGEGCETTKIIGEARPEGVVLAADITDAIFSNFTVTVEVPIQDIDLGFRIDGITDNSFSISHCIITGTQYGMNILSPAEPAIESNTFVADRDERAIYIGSDPCSPIIRNNIIAEYYVGIHYDNQGLPGITPIIEYNNVYGNESSYRGLDYLTGIDGNIADDPMFVSRNLGKFALLPGSACIDAGDPSYPLDENGSNIEIGAIPFTAPMDNHFIPIWYPGNGVDHMNLYALTASIDGNDMEAGDEIGIYDGDVCVGAGILKAILEEGIYYMAMVASKDDEETPATDGYNPDNEISFRIWDSSEGEELTQVDVSYKYGSGIFRIGGSASFHINGTKTIEGSVPVSEGWNMLSLPVAPSDIRMMSIIQPLIDNGSLVKVQDEAGNAIEYIVPIGWVDNIGDWSPSEGYKLRVNGDAVLEFSGSPLEDPQLIDFIAGWNIMGYPWSEPQSALAAFSGLMDNNLLVKVQDETGNAIENVFPIGWLDNVHNLEPGEGYKVNVSGDCNLALSRPIVAFKSVTLPDAISDDIRHFTQAYPGNGHDHMNIYLLEASVNGSGLQEGDEIGVYDGDLCVGATLISSSSQGVLSIATSMDDPTTTEQDGFIEGHAIELRIWSKSNNMEITPEVIFQSGYKGMFERMGTTVVSIQGEASVIMDLDGVVSQSSLGEIYPNPFREETTIPYTIARDTRVDMAIYDLTGKRIRTLVSQDVRAGGHAVKWDGRDQNNVKIPYGIYVCRMVAGEVAASKKIELY